MFDFTALLQLILSALGLADGGFLSALFTALGWL